ncbi:MAG: dienelactone hydrolase family protein, partial [Burkholderiales bacterium]|nr:dienelactone hydrolase family protein [Burkholderiales bacterium]
MPRLTTDDFHPEVLKLFNRYIHGRIDRREFLSGASRYTGAGVSAAMLLQALSPDYALAEQVAPDDARLGARRAEFESPAGYGRG